MKWNPPPSDQFCFHSGISNAVWSENIWCFSASQKAARYLNVWPTKVWAHQIYTDPSTLLCFSDVVCLSHWLSHRAPATPPTHPRCKSEHGVMLQTRQKWTQLNCWEVWVHHVGLEAPQVECGPFSPVGLEVRAERTFVQKRKVLHISTEHITQCFAAGRMVIWNHCAEL